MKRRILTAWDVRVRLAAALGWIIVLIFTRHPAAPLAMSLVLIAVIALDPGMSLKEAGHQLRHIAPFIILMLVTLSLSDGLPMTRDALNFALLIGTRVLAAVLVIIAMTAGDSAENFIRSIAVLPIPPLLLSLLFLVNRYIHLIARDYHIQRMALRSRMFTPKASLGVLRNLGYVIGGMFIRGYDRSEHVYAAMRARCFSGVIPFEDPGLLRLSDVLRLIIAMVPAAAVLWLERILFA